MKLFFGGGESHFSSLTGGISCGRHEIWQRDKRAMKNDHHLGCIAPTLTPSFIQSSYWSMGAVSLGKVTVGVWGVILQENAFPTETPRNDKDTVSMACFQLWSSGSFTCIHSEIKGYQNHKGLVWPLIGRWENEGKERAGDWHRVTQKIWSRAQVERGFLAAVTWTSTLTFLPLSISFTVETLGSQLLVKHRREKCRETEAKETRDS